MKRCPDCGGRGVWQDNEDRGGETVITQKYCNTCHGRGIVSTGPEGDDDFDLAGVGVTEDDDDF